MDRRVLFIAPMALLALAGACTFVKMAPGGAEVRVARADRDLGACQRRGEIAVSVKDRLGPYQRDPIRVRDELETLARNEAPGLQADTVQPKTEPVDGEQRFLAFRCRDANLNAPDAPAAAASSAQTIPLKQ
jgi:hypothetical protein